MQRLALALGFGRQARGPAREKPLAAQREERAGRHAPAPRRDQPGPDGPPVAVEGADVNAKDAEDFTPLHMAAFHREAAYALELLEAGADVSAKTVSGRTPLSMAEKARADETSGVISLWILKGCGIGTRRNVQKLLK